MVECKPSYTIAKRNRTVRVNVASNSCCKFFTKKRVNPWTRRNASFRFSSSKKYIVGAYTCTVKIATTYTLFKFFHAMHGIFPTYRRISLTKIDRKYGMDEKMDDWNESIFIREFNQKKISRYNLSFAYE